MVVIVWTGKAYVEVYVFPAALLNEDEGLEEGYFALTLLVEEVTGQQQGRIIVLGKSKVGPLIKKQYYFN